MILLGTEIETATDCPADALNIPSTKFIGVLRKIEDNTFIIFTANPKLLQVCESSFRGK